MSSAWSIGAPLDKIRIGRNRANLDIPQRILPGLIIAIWMQTGRLAHGQPQDSLAGESAAEALKRTIEAYHCVAAGPAAFDWRNSCRPSCEED
jgi:hypothetical protein